VIAGCPILPATDTWNTDISQAPVSAHSSDWVGAIGASAGLHADFGTVWQGAPNGIPFIVVGPGEPLVPVTFEYASESDPGPYPAPLTAPIEGGSASLGDRHVLVLQQGSCLLYEMYNAHPLNGAWKAGSGAIWDLSQSQQRHERWTSADAAGLPILPGLVRYDEVATGEIRHALRFTANWIQSAYIYPAVHSDGRSGSDPTHPPMGARFRLRASFDESPFPAEVQVMLRAMKRYGLILADTGGDWMVSGAPDPRWSDANLTTFASIKGSDFEAIENGAVHPF
jgi:hypothetical protein